MQSVSVATLKSNLGRYLAAVRRGKEIVITSRRHPIARIVPAKKALMDDLKIIPAGKPDAHLATAVRLAESTGIELTFLTHDAELGTAARSMNFVVEGV